MGGWSFEIPARKEDVPAPRTQAVRRINLDDDGERWIEVRGGGSQVEGRFIGWVFDLVRGPFETKEAEDAASLEMDAYLATFIADRVVAHNLVDDDGQALPIGLDLFWSLSTADALQLLNLLRTPPQVIGDPKAARTSSGG
jgi:hypothetical protein